MSSPNANGLTDRQHHLVVVAAVSIAGPTIAVGLRFLSRRLCHAKLWWDDYCCLVAMILAYGPCICVILSVQHGLGRHFNELTTPDVIEIFKIFYPLQITWTMSFGFTYVAIALLYIRLFPETRLRKIAIVMGVIGGLAAISDVGILIWQCTPIAFFWDKSIPGGHCIEQSKTYVSCSAFVVVLTFILFLVPIPTIYGLHMTPMKKFGLVLTLSTGAFVCLTSLFRIISLLQLDNNDISWSATNTQIWSDLEASFAVVVCCLPSMRPLLRLLIEGRRKTEASDPCSDGSAGKPRFNRIVDRSDPTATFSERIDLQSVAHPAQDDQDDRARLVTVKEPTKPNNIMITDQVLQVTELAHPMDLEKQKKEDGISPNAWQTRSPP